MWIHFLERKDNNVYTWFVFPLFAQFICNISWFMKRVSCLLSIKSSSLLETLYKSSASLVGICTVWEWREEKNGTKDNKFVD